MNTDFSSSLESAGYILETNLKIWVRLDYAGLPCNDGELFEKHIAEIICNANDLSVLSLELALHCNDWPMLYHLSRRRANVLRPFEDQLEGRTVLEIGAGCGAITRYLGEIGAQVLGVEGGIRKASIAASRCRDLSNVTIVADAFHQFRSPCQFDVVMFIGVLENARLFFSGEDKDPVNLMLASVKNFLKPGGKLIIAIENQLGLKFFAGFPEGHVGKPMFGIEEHYREDTIVTFGRRELSRRVGKIGLTKQQWWYPFPDYKLPSLMVSEAGALPQDDIDLTAIVRNSCSGDPQYPRSISFNQERALRPIVRNGLLHEMANSFLLLATDADSLQQRDLPLCVHYATDRRAEFAKKVVFFRTGDDMVITCQSALYPFAMPSENSMLKQQLIDQPFVKGELWQDYLIQIMTSPGWTLEQIQKWTRTWFDALCAMTGISKFENITNKKISGKYIDAIPRNMFISEDATPIFIDQEWFFSKDLYVDYIIFRALLVSFLSIGVAAKPAEDKYVQISQLLTCVMRRIGSELTESKIKEFLELEEELDQLASGKQPLNNEELAPWFASLEFHIFDTQTPVHEKILQHDEQVAILGQALSQRDEQLIDIFNSTSWRITRPLRTVGKWLKML